jgi:hypothetical protein
MAFVAINAVQINSFKKQITNNGKNIATLTIIREIQEKYLEHLDLKNVSQNKIIFNVLRYKVVM